MLTGPQEKVQIADHGFRGPGVGEGEAPHLHAAGAGPGCPPVSDPPGPDAVAPRAGSGPDSAAASGIRPTVTGSHSPLLPSPWTKPCRAGWRACDTEVTAPGIAPAVTPLRTSQGAASRISRRGPSR
ncbi:hypothetical protein HDA41_001059 [Streptomyces caelestis]|uniref:Uncharacterized protein n=1 Tax=Streptomyces caelestis TaxID=36816 RepID=A0A7W9GZX7_9ACTN|nr:hypothetical protein [Streptomyces caelestis]